MTRRLVRPLRSALLLIGFSCLPVATLFMRHAEQARDSVLHVLISFSVLMLVFRVIGKRELSQLSPFELVTLMLIPEILSNTVQGESSLLQSLAGLSTVVLLVVLTSTLSQRFEKVQTLVEASPTMLVSDGRLLEDNMNAERIAPEELFSEMRKQGLETLDEVRFAILESGGNITFIPRSPPPAGAAGSDRDPTSAA